MSGTSVGCCLSMGERNVSSNSYAPLAVANPYDTHARCRITRCSCKDVVVRHRSESDYSIEEIFFIIDSMLRQSERSGGTDQLAGST